MLAKSVKSVLKVTLAGLAVVALATATLNGCAGEAGDAGRIIAAVPSDPFPLPEKSAREVSRFDAVFREYASDPGNSRELKQFRDAYKRVRVFYVRPVPDAELVDAAIEGVRADDKPPGSRPAGAVVESALDAMTASLDPHSTYLNPQELEDAELVTSGEFGGLGIQVSREDGKIKVISPIEDTPADRAGLRPGDLITHVEGRPVADMTLMAAVHAMRGKPGTTVRLTIRRAGRRPFVVRIRRAVIAVKPVRWKVYGDVGYVRLVSFSEKATGELKKAVREIEKRLGKGAKGIVLDLRNNPGGLFDQALLISDAFLGEGIIVGVRGRDKSTARAFRAGPGDVAAGLPMVVLVNGGSASASEIVASALKENGRATVMGTRTFGKGSVQTVMRLPVGGALKLTTALYYAPSGKTIQARGVAPDILLEGIATGSGPATHEADLPKALPGPDTEWQRKAQARVDAATCPAIGEKKDRPLGCAVEFLHAGSVRRFLSELIGDSTG